jgi:drug/metabolite transporter (DMT)-like permease
MLRRHLATALVLAILLGLLAGVLWSTYRVWTHIDTSMSVHGWIALTLGVVFSLIVGVGLMALMFFSSRRGYDEPPTFKE